MLQKSFFSFNLFRFFFDISSSLGKGKGRYFLLTRKREDGNKRLTRLQLTRMEYPKREGNKTLEGECVAIDDNGKGIVRLNGQTLFVDNLLPSEKAELEVETYKDEISAIKVKRRLNDSPLRVKPLCPYYQECGGCSLMHLSYQGQLEYKRDKVKNLLHKFAKIDFEPSPTLGMASPYRFRNKVQVPIRLVKGQVVSGFFKENTHQIVPLEDCLIETEEAEKILKGIKKLLTKYHIPPYDEDKGRGLIRHILIKESLHFKETMVVLVTSNRDFYGKVNLAKEIVKMFPEVTTVVQNINTRHTNVILGEQEDVLFGSGKIKDSIFNLSFLISSRSFYQTNPLQTEVLYKTALDQAGLTGQEEVLDAYSGTGTIGLCASIKAKKVLGVEIEPSAVRDARLNAKMNKIPNAEFIQADCTTYLLENKEKAHFDVVFMDPPRKGSTPEFLLALKEIKPKKIIYISCNPVTLARDLADLKDTYDLISVTPVDMFPQTSHVETVVALSLKSRKVTINRN